MSDRRDEWYFCMKHRQAEPWNGCRNSDRLGPYRTKEEAEHALETAAQRTEKWDKEDELWDDGT
ncbi:MAG TPA: hypothetical protein VI076_12235 [Actinopolymorphaceae bacterium]